MPSTTTTIPRLVLLPASDTTGSSSGVVMATRTKPGMRHETNMNVYMDDETDDTN